MSRYFKILGIAFPFIIGFLVVALSNDQEVILESQESKTNNGTPIFNKIKFFSFRDKDVWMMNQSHHGLDKNKDKDKDRNRVRETEESDVDGVRGNTPKKSWDRLAIVVDKTQSPKRARFYQFKPGPLEWQEGLEEAPFKVSCFLCHNNGPRNIRPNFESALNPISWQNRIKISYWNFRMKFYGRILPDEWHQEQDQKYLANRMDQSAHSSQSLSLPFRFQSAYENEPLRVAVCVKCHRESGFSARGLLRRQQFATIRFMLDTNQMPPKGYSISAKEKQEMEKFLMGF